MANFVKVATHGELKPGEGKSLLVENVPIALFYVGDKYYAIEDTCCHRGGPLGEGSVDGLSVACPWHGWEFDLVTGECRTNPGARQRTYEVKVEGNDILVGLE
ncbi:MAG: non-heme iron oxygenase ferredoxin subunit [Candidatus Hydrogenedentota bacterium]|jgi:nitrite reductase/ring-hydroxylating ferredoxin subunit|uniref:Ferredoxin, 2Fe-2S n=1 Tax=Sumerlaea chitinivorans TaxID=2250252 RepID=A0A2Z4Y7P6_SUMC1|nr:Ferredoxin, 2Fe-2S [Candidatus Sumerlaea chitinivorans]RMH25644.1 MAG: non-heme iron oxygenase ferredoxin subunit [Candidatus Hydrogenedentota bacterium]GIX43849.1 MAG: hypothetical protein KatS3mg130_0257 [Candidatus Sumerlaea sp.]